jgi:hypothetical protein
MFSSGSIKGVGGFFALVLVLVALLGLASPAGAAVYYWTGGQTGAASTTNPLTGSWSVAGNWSPSAGTSSTTTELDFGGSTAQAGPYTATDDIAGAFQLQYLRLLSTDTNDTNVIAASGGTLNFVNAPYIYQAGSGPFQITAPILLGAALNINETGAGNVDLNGPVNLNGFALTVNGGSAGGSTTISGNITGTTTITTQGLTGGTVKFARLALTGSNSATATGTTKAKSWASWRC